MIEKRALPGQRVARGGIEPPTFRFSGGRSYQLSYLAVSATLTYGRANKGPAVGAGLQQV